MEVISSGNPTPPASLDTPGRTPLGLLGLFYIAALLTTAGCLTAPFLSYDDLSQIALRPELKPESSWKPIFTQSFYGVYNPVAMASYKLHYLCIGTWPWSFRLFDVMVHALNGFLLLLFLKRLGFEKSLALFGALCWTVHPLAVESVAWISQRQNVLAFFFGISALLIRMKWPGWKGIFAAYTLFILALLSKPSALSFAPIFIFLEFGGVEYWAGRSPVRVGFRSLPVVLPILLFAAITSKAAMHLAADRVVSPPGGTLFTALLTDVEIFTRYILNFFMPTQLSAYYFVHDIRSLSDSHLWLWSALLAGILYLSYALSENKRMLALGWLCFFSALGPNANLVGSQQVMQDRYVYIASAGLVIVLLENIRGIRKRFAITGFVEVTVAVLVLVLLGVGSIFRSTYWVNSTKLFSDAANCQPDSGPPHYYLAITTLDLARQARLKNDGNPTLESNAGFQRALDLQIFAENCADAYRYHDPLTLRVDLAQEAVEIGQIPAALRLLDGFTPPPPPDPGAFPLEPGGPEYSLMKGPGGYPIRYQKSVLSRCHLLRAELRVIHVESNRLLGNDAAQQFDLALAQVSAARELKNSWECDWMEARIHWVWATQLQAGRDAEGTTKHRKTAANLLQRIPPGTPLYENAQAMIKVVEKE